MTTTPADDDAAAALAALSASFRARDVDAALACFSDSGSVIYAGSEAGEIAHGRDALVALLRTVFAREVAYSWTLTRLWAADHGPHLAVVADVVGAEHGCGGGEDFPYRISGMLQRDAGECRWLFVSASEPASPTAPGSLPPFSPAAVDHARGAELCPGWAAPAQGAGAPHR